MHNHHFHNNHNRGPFTNISSSLTVDFIQRAGWANGWVTLHPIMKVITLRVRMSCRCDDNFTTNYAPSRSSPSHTVDVEDFTAVRAEVCYPHPSYWIKLCLVFNKLSFKNVIADFFWLSASIYSEWNCSCWWMSNSRWKKKKMEFWSQHSPHAHRLSNQPALSRNLKWLHTDFSTFTQGPHRPHDGVHAAYCIWNHS